MTRPNLVGIPFPGSFPLLSPFLEDNINHHSPEKLFRDPVLSEFCDSLLEYDTSRCFFLDPFALVTARSSLKFGALFVLSVIASSLSSLIPLLCFCPSASFFCIGVFTSCFVVATAPLELGPASCACCFAALLPANRKGSYFEVESEPSSSSQFCDFDRGLLFVLKLMSPGLRGRSLSSFWLNCRWLRLFPTLG